MGLMGMGLIVPFPLVPSFHFAPCFMISALITPLGRRRGRDLDETRRFRCLRTMTPLPVLFTSACIVGDRNNQCGGRESQWSRAKKRGRDVVGPPRPSFLDPDAAFSPLAHSRPAESRLVCLDARKDYSEMRRSNTSRGFAPGVGRGWAGQRRVLEAMARTAWAGLKVGSDRRADDAQTSQTSHFAPLIV